MSGYQESDSEGEEVGESSEDDSEYQVILARDRSGRLVYMGDDDGNAPGEEEEDYEEESEAEDSGDDGEVEYSEPSDEES